MQNKRVWDLKCLNTGRIESPEVKKLERITALREYDTFAEAVSAGLMTVGDLYLLGGEVTLYAGPETEPETFVNMVMVFNVASPGDTIYHGTGTYTNCIIEWEDGSTATYNSTGSPSHVFSTAGEKLVTVKGVVTNFTFSGTTSRTRLVEVQQFGEQATYAANAFSGCTNLTGISEIDAPVFATTSLQFFFFQCAALEDGDFSGWDVSSITNFSGMFRSCTLFNNSSIGAWDVSAATTLGAMFKAASTFNQSLASWTWPVATCSFSEMFYGASSLVSASWLDLSNASSCSYLFYTCTSLNFSINALDYSNLTTAAYMYYGCTSLAPSTIALGTLTNCTQTYYTFYGCTSLNPTSISFSVPAVTLMSSMFDSCTALTSPTLTITMPTVNFTAASLFNGCTSFTGNDIDTLDVSYCTSLSAAFTNTALTTANYDAALAAWAALTVQSGVTLSSAPCMYTDATSHDELTGTDTWTITDYGKAPVAYWKADEGSGTSIAATIGSNDSTSFTGTWVTGKLGYGVDFNASSTHTATFPITNIPTGNSARSCSFWINFTTIATGNLISWGPAGTMFLIQTSGSALRVHEWGKDTGSDDFLTSSGYFTTGSWIHIVITYDGNKNFNAYKNGSAYGSQSIALDLTTAASGNVTFQYNTGGTHQFSLDEVAIFDYELNSTQVSYIYNSGSGRDLSV